MFFIHAPPSPPSGIYKIRSATNIRQGLYQLSHLASYCLANILKQKSTNYIQLI